MKRHSECKQACQYAKDVGMVEYSCHRLCQYKQRDKTIMRFRLLFTAILVVLLGLLYVAFNKTTTDSDPAPDAVSAPASSSGDQPSQYSGLGK